MILISNGNLFSLDITCFLPEVREFITIHTAYNKHDTGWAKGAPSEDHTTPPSSRTASGGRLLFTVVASNFNQAHPHTTLFGLLFTPCPLKLGIVYPHFPATRAALPRIPVLCAPHLPVELYSS